MSQQVFDRFYPTAPTMDFFDRFSLVSYRVFKSPAERISKGMPLLHEDLLKSNLRITPVGLVSVALFSATISGLAALGVIVWSLFSHIPYLYLTAIAPVLVFMLVLNGPKISKSSRGAALENELPFVIGYLSVLAGGGLSLIDTLRQIADIDIFKAASSEAKRIILDIDVFGHDPITALDRAAKYSPSHDWGQLLTGYTTVLRTGGDHLNYLNLHLAEEFEKVSARLKRSVETVGLVAESFLIVTVVLGITLFTLYLVQSLVGGAAGGISNVFLFSFIIVPLLSAAFVWLMDSFGQKWPMNDYRPYRIFLYFIPVGIVIFLIPLPILLYLHLAVALVAISLVPSIYASKYSRERRIVDMMLPEFIGDVAEQRKIGLAPEESIERLGEGNSYSAFSKYVNKMAGQLSWGVSLRKVMDTFTSQVTSWMAKAVGILMLEVIEVGGGTVRGFEDMAAFTFRVSASESEAKSSLRPYVMIIYIGGIMLTLTTFMMVFMLSQQTSLASHGLFTNGGGNNATTVDLLLTAAIFQSWVLGLVAGKMGEGALSEGFKHSVILVILNIVAVVVVSRFVLVPI